MVDEQIIKDELETKVDYKKFEPIMILDYFIVLILAGSILSYHYYSGFIGNIFYPDVKAFVVWISTLLFFSYWIFRIIFNKKYETLISN